MSSSSESEAPPVLERFSDDENSNDETMVAELEAKLTKLKLKMQRKRPARSSLVSLRSPVPRSRERTINSDSNEEYYSPTRAASLSGPSVNLPKQEISKFTGDPLDYVRFHRAFTGGVSRYVRDPVSRLSYLIGYCDGEARQAIDHCTILEPEEGYKEAWSILRQYYGQPFMIARTYLSQITDGPMIKAQDDKALLALSRKMNACELTLSRLNYTAELNTHGTIKSIVNRLPLFMQSRWFDVASETMFTSGEPSFTDLTRFIRSRAEAATTRSMYVTTTTSHHARIPEQSSPGPNVRLCTLATSASVPFSPNEGQTSSFRPSCIYCRGSHYLDRCDQFIACSVAVRKQFIASAALCRLCLKPRHQPDQCRTRRVCGISGCLAQHHPLLHQATPTGEDNAIQNVNVNTTRELTSSCKVALAVVKVNLIGPGGRVSVNALLDSGSDSTLITTVVARELGLSGSTTELNLQTFSGRTTITAERVRLQIDTSLSDSSLQDLVAWSVPHMPKVTEFIPSKNQLSRWKHLADLPVHTLDQPISMLIGTDTPFAHWVLECRVGTPRDPFAIKTPLGWVFLGPTEACLPRTGNDIHLNVLSGLTEKSIHNQIESMYDNDFTEQSMGKGRSQDDELALSIVKASMGKVDGHYELPLPWKPDAPDLPLNLPVASKRLNALRARLTRDESLRLMYTEAIEEYITRGYAEPAGEIVPQRTWFLPHHPVVHPHKPGKVRVVFDCASKYRGTSMNEQLLSGPDMGNSLVGVLLRFRQYAYVVTADVEAMFHQVKVPTTDRDALRFLWWKNGNLSTTPNVYRMTVHPFGATSSPFCAIWALRRSIEDNKTLFHKNTDLEVKRSFYVDDLLYSTQSIEQLNDVSNAVTEALAAGGFRLTKWSSNAAEFLSKVNVEDRAPGFVSLDLQHPHWHRALGIQYDMASDCFRFQVNWETKVPTKRIMLSCIASLYDPLGFVGPVVLIGRLIFRQVCIDTSSWDEALTARAVERWNRWVIDLRRLPELTIPRCLTIGQRQQGTYQLHCFSDASEAAYGAALYLRFQDSNKRHRCTLICGKARVAPLKNVTIPRLELTAALLAARLAKQCQEELSLSISSIYLWTDSTVVLMMIRNRKTRFQSFVANRLSAIREICPTSQWRFVDGCLNPADIASRGSSPNLLRDSIWFAGPPFLCSDEDQWPVEPQTDSSIPADFIRKVQSHIFMSTQVPQQWLDNLARFSSWSKLLRATAWLRRFCQWIRQRRPRIIGGKFLTSVELRMSALVLVRLTQQAAFGADTVSMISRSATGTTRVLKKSANPLRKLRPFVHEGLLRVGGRLRWAALPFETKHPAILPKRHFVTSLLIRHYHEINGHVGIGQVLNAVRQKYWILQGHAAVKSVLSDCRFCRLWFSTPCQQAMAPLPLDRMRTNTRPFACTGVDYFGPLLVKRGRGTEKRYGCVFTCLTMRAVHVEVTRSLDTDSFLCAFSRFVSRRGSPVRLHSDNGTNFRGAEADIRTCLKGWNQTTISNKLLNYDCDWIFTPPKASHRGGIWERMIRSIRRILRSLLGETLVDDEVLQTALTEVEKILNSRPLVRVTADSEEDIVLTPNHLLLLTENIATSGTTNVQNLSKRWRKANQIADQFWKRWLAEYLPSLQTVSRWINSGRNMKVGDVVLLNDVTTPRGQWSKGIVAQVVVARDGLVRDVVVRTVRGLLRRDVRQLHLLEAHEETEYAENGRSTLIEDVSTRDDLIPSRDDDVSPRDGLIPSRDDDGPMVNGLIPTRDDDGPMMNGLLPSRDDNGSMRDDSVSSSVEASCN